MNYVEMPGGSVNGTGAPTAWSGEASLFTPPEPWMQNALCAETDPDLFFPERGGDPGRVAEAKKVCAKCTVVDECLQFAIENGERDGIWGGLTRIQRSRLRKSGVAS